MPTQNVEFQFITGLKRAIFQNGRLRGSWNGNGRYSADWTESPMQDAIGEDGCPIFKASISLDLADQDKMFRWGVAVNGPQGNNLWGIPTEIQDMNSAERFRQFRLTGGGTSQVERYYFTYGRRLGANKHFATGTSNPGLLFAVWAPNAQSVQVVFGKPANGFIANDGTGIDSTQPVVALLRAADGIWQGGPSGDFEHFKSLPYMYRIVNADGQTVYRTDIFSRSQIGRGGISPLNPITGSWTGTVDTLDGTVSCSVVIDPDVVPKRAVGDQSALAKRRERASLEGAFYGS